VTRPPVVFTSRASNFVPVCSMISVNMVIPITPKFRGVHILHPSRKALVCLDYCGFSRDTSRTHDEGIVCCCARRLAIETNPLEYAEVAMPQRKSVKLWVRVRTCACADTDLPRHS